jgi:hypothetical protein
VSAANGCFASSINGLWIRQHGCHSSLLLPWPVRAAAAGPSGPTAAWADGWCVAAAGRHFKGSSAGARARDCFRHCPVVVVGGGGCCPWLCSRRRWRRLIQDHVSP